jgi:hypothetical protein
MTVGGAASPNTVGLQTQTVSGRILIAAAGNGNQINAFAADGSPAGLVLGAQAQPTQVAALTVNSLSVASKVGTVAAPIIPVALGGTGLLGYAGTLGIFTIGGPGNVPFQGLFSMPAGCSTESHLHVILEVVSPEVGGNVPAIIDAPQVVMSAGGPTGVQATLTYGQDGALNCSATAKYFVIV